MNTTHLILFSFFNGARSVPTGAALGSSLLDHKQIMKACFDTTNNAFRTKDQGGPSGQSGGLRDWTQVIKEVYDDQNNALRVVQV